MALLSAAKQSTGRNVKDCYQGRNLFSNGLLLFSSQMIQMLFFSLLFISSHHRPSDDVKFQLWRLWLFLALCSFWDDRIVQWSKFKWKNSGRQGCGEGWAVCKNPVKTWVRTSRVQCIDFVVKVQEVCFLAGWNSSQLLMTSWAREMGFDAIQGVIPQFMSSASASLISSCPLPAIHSQLSSNAVPPLPWPYGKPDVWK